MSQSNGEKARANLAKRRRTKQRLKDRVARAAAKAGGSATEATKGASNDAK